MDFLAKYNTSRTYQFPLVGIESSASGNYILSPTFVAGDVKISKDGGSMSDTTNLPIKITGSTGLFVLTLTPTEHQCSGAIIQIADGHVKTWQDQSFLITTYGHASAMHAFDFDTPTQTVLLDSTETLYYADIKFNKDNPNSQDEYTCSWFKKDQPFLGSISDLNLWVKKRSDGSDLISPTGMSEVGSTRVFKYDESNSGRRTTNGEAYIILVSGTVDSSVKVWRNIVSRDS